MRLFLATLLFLQVVFSFGQAASTTPEKVYIFKIHEMIAPPIWRKTKRALKEADSINADLIVVDMNTYGGMVNIADKIRTALLNAKIPVWVFIQNNAASAGAFISIACDSIYMKPGAVIGASTVVTGQGEKAGEKYQAFMQSKMRATAIENGRDPEIAAAMVEAEKTIPGLVDSGNVVSFSASEALSYDFCDGIYSNIETMLKAEGYANATIVRQQISAIDDIIHFFMRPAVSGFLITLIFLGIIWELKSPGIDLALLVAGVAALFYFVPLYLEGLASYWEIAIFAIGIILIIVEIFVIPGFGIAGVLGGILMLAGLSLAVADTVNNPDFMFPVPDANALVRGLVTVFIAMILSGVITYFFGRTIFRSNLFKKASVATVHSSSDGYISTKSLPKSLEGQIAVASSAIRPMGSVEIEDKEYEALSIQGYIEKGSKVKIVEVETTKVLVKLV